MAGPRRVLIGAPMSSELRPLVRYAGARREVSSGLVFHRASVAGTDVVITKLGVGPDRAREVTERALRMFEFDHVLVSGIAGGLHRDFRIGTVVVPDGVIDISSGKRYESSPIADVERRCVLGCADHLIVDDKELAQLEESGVVALEMESSGVAAACEAAGVPWTTFRVVSDRPDDGLTDESVMAMLRPDGTSDVRAALRFMLGHPGRVPGMMRLGRDSQMGAAKAARVTLGALGWSGDRRGRGAGG